MKLNPAHMTVSPDPLAIEKNFFIEDNEGLVLAGKKKSRTLIIYLQVQAIF